MGISFLKRLRESIARGEIGCTIRIWQRPQVKVGGRYMMEGGFVRVTRMQQRQRNFMSPMPPHQPRNAPPSPVDVNREKVDEFIAGTNSGNDVEVPAGDAATD